MTAEAHVHEWEPDTTLDGWRCEDNSCHAYQFGTPRRPESDTAFTSSDLFTPLTPANPAAVAKKCPHPRAYRRGGEDGTVYCGRCHHTFDPAVSRRSRNNRKRGGKAELDAARLVGGRKVGPLGQPWDVEMPGYARLQVRKYATPESLRKVAAELGRIGSGAEMPGYVWIEPGRGGERLIVFRLADFAERHGVEVGEDGVRRG